MTPEETSDAMERMRQAPDIDRCRKLTAQDIMDYLQERGASTECPSCHQNDWIIPQKAQDGWLALPIEIGGGFGKGSTLRVCMMICRNCNFVRQHALGPIGIWKEWKDLDREFGIKRV